MGLELITAETKPHVPGFDYDTVFEPATGGQPATLTIRLRTCVRAFPTQYAWDRIASGHVAIVTRPRDVPSDEEWRWAYPRALSPGAVDQFAHAIKTQVEGTLDGVYWLHPCTLDGQPACHPPIRCQIQVQLTDDWASAHFSCLVIDAVDASGKSRDVGARVQRIGGVRDTHFPHGYDALFDLGNTVPKDRNGDCASKMLLTQEVQDRLGYPKGVPFPECPDMPMQQSVIVHELLHHFGMFHKGARAIEDPLLASAFQYGDPRFFPGIWRDYMAAGDELDLQHAIPWLRRVSRHQLGFEAYPSASMSVSMDAAHTGPATPVREVLAEVRRGEEGCGTCQPAMTVDEQDQERRDLIRLLDAAP